MDLPGTAEGKVQSRAGESGKLCCSGWRSSWNAPEFGILPTRNHELERAIHNARRQASISKRVLFLSRTREVFNLGHMVHRPFSCFFAILAIVHIVVVLAMGYM